MSKTTLYIDVGDRFDEARTFGRENGDKPLRALIETYAPKFPKDQTPTAAQLDLPLKRFLFQKVKLTGGECVATGDECPSDLRLELDELWEKEEKDELRPEMGHFPEIINDDLAVRIAYRLELDAITDFLRNGLSVLVVCDKMLTELIYEFVISRAGKKCVKDTDKPEEAQRQGMGGRLDQAMQGGQAADPQANLAKILNNLKEDETLVLRSLDMLDNPAMIEQLYQYTAKGKKPHLLAFLDPSLEVKKVLSDRFAVHIPMMGLPRYTPDPAVKDETCEADLEEKTGKARKTRGVYCVTQLLTRKERECFKTYEEEGLYKNVAGLNVMQFRNAMQYVGARVQTNTEPREIYRRIRQFKTSSSGEIEIPDTTFEDIGGYDHIKAQLKRIIALIAGPVEGLDDRRRAQLIPRGLIFHGPPGTGKTLFAKAIANEMNATIQMISGPEIMDKYVGESENKLRRIFATARRNAPAVVFFDEFDSIASQRSTYSDGGARANNAVVAQLLTELDGFRQDQTVLVIGTTNRIDIIDEALIRPSRFRPVEIGRPDPIARRRVAEIHAENFGIDTLVMDLYSLASKHLQDWLTGADTDAQRKIPEQFLKELFEHHPVYEKRYRMEDSQVGFLRDLKELFVFARDCRNDTEPDSNAVDRIREELTKMAANYGLDLTTVVQADDGGPEDEPWLTPMRNDIRDLFTLLVQEKKKSGGASPENFWNNVLELIAEYTEGFNNDEIRAIFQEAGLERHMEGRLITPRYLGQKIGLVRKRRDEREHVHLSEQRR